MKRIEDETIPILKPMIHGKHPSVLTIADQKILSRWISLRAIVWNAYIAKNSSEMFFTENARTKFLNSDDPLEHSFVVAAAALPSHRVNFESFGFGLRPINSPVGSGVRFLETTCLIRQVAVQSIVGKENQFPSQMVNPNSPIGQIVKQIWPSFGSRRWPPSGSLGSDGYNSLKGLFARSVVAHFTSLSGEGMK